MKLIITSFLLTLLIITALSPLSSSTRPGSDGPFSAESKNSQNENNNNNGGMGGFFGSGSGSGSGFDIPGFGKGFGKGFGNGIVGGGYGGGYGSPSGGSSKGGIIRPTLVCKDKGPCFNKKLTCPAKCFTSYSRSGKGYGGGGGGGGCTMDCKKKCTAYC